jgi:hypothetical protein
MVWAEEQERANLAGAKNRGSTKQVRATLADCKFKMADSKWERTSQQAKIRRAVTR